MIITIPQMLNQNLIWSNGVKLDIIHSPSIIALFFYFSALAKEIFFGSTPLILDEKNY